MKPTKEKAISFCRALIPRAIDGSKTMTRRVVKPQPTSSNCGEDYLDWKRSGKQIPGHYAKQSFARFCAPHQKDDILWVREEYYEYGRWVVDGKTKTGKDKLKFAPRKNYHLYPIYYPDTLPPGTKITKGRPVGEWGYFWRNPRFMPRYAARLFLRVTGVRVERLQDIGEEDATREGVELRCKIMECDDYAPTDAHTCKTMGLCYKQAFANLWDGLNKKRGYGWDSNCYVFVVEFERVTEGK